MSKCNSCGGEMMPDRRGGYYGGDLCPSSKCPAGQPGVLIAPDMAKMIAFPVKSDEYGMYLWDAENNMLADDGGKDDADEGIRAFAAAAINWANSYGSKPSIESVPVMFPVHVDEEALNILDLNGKHVLRIRGWGRLQKLGHKEGVEAQRQIGEAFAAAMNAAAA